MNKEFILQSLANIQEAVEHTQKAICGELFSVDPENVCVDGDFMKTYFQPSEISRRPITDRYDELSAHYGEVRFRAYVERGRV